MIFNYNNILYMDDNYTWRKYESIEEFEIRRLLNEIQQLKREINKKDSEIKILEFEKKHYREIIEMMNFKR